MNYPRSIEKFGSSNGPLARRDCIARPSLDTIVVGRDCRLSAIVDVYTGDNFVAAIKPRRGNDNDDGSTARATRSTLFARLGSTRRICKSCLRYINKVLINTNEADAYDTCITIVLSVSCLASPLPRILDGRISAHSSWIAAVCKYICKSARCFIDIVARSFIIREEVGCSIGKRQGS